MYTEKELADLEQFFKSTTLPKTIQLTPAENITDTKLFYKNHLTVLRANMGSKTFSAFYDRLVKLRSLLQQ